MLTVLLNPIEFVTLFGFLSRISRTYIDLPLKLQPVPVSVILGFQSKIRIEHVFAWRARKSDRRYKYKMPPQVARALHYQLTNHPVSHHEQMLLDCIDEAITSYRVPQAQRHTILSLPAYA